MKGVGIVFIAAMLFVSNNVNAQVKDGPGLRCVGSITGNAFGANFDVKVYTQDPDGFSDQVQISNGTGEYTWVKATLLKPHATEIFRAVLAPIHPMVNVGLVIRGNSTKGLLFYSPNKPGQPLRIFATGDADCIPFF